MVDVQNAIIIKKLNVQIVEKKCLLIDILQFQILIYVKHVIH